MRCKLNSDSNQSINVFFTKSTLTSMTHNVIRSFTNKQILPQSDDERQHGEVILKSLKFTIQMSLLFIMCSEKQTILGSSRAMNILSEINLPSKTLTFWCSKRK